MVEIFQFIITLLKQTTVYKYFAQKATQFQLKMKNYSSTFSSTAQQYLKNVLNVAKDKHKCENCFLQFQSASELLNHKKKFCTDSGFDTLAGLNIKLKNPHYKNQQKQKRKIDDSLVNEMQDIQRKKIFIPHQKEMINDIQQYQRHQEDTKYYRPYLHGSKNSIQNKQSGRKSRSLYILENEAKQKTNQGQKPSKQQLPYLHRPQKDSKAYSFTQSYIKKFKSSDVSISPATQPENRFVAQKQNAKMFSLLDKSDMSIKNMPNDQKREYVVRKLLQLEQIDENYRKNGGLNEAFVQNTKRMRQFYKKLLQDVNNNNMSKFGKLSNGTRVSTPISKLDQLKQSNVSFESNTKRQDQNKLMMGSRISQIHQKSMAKRQDQVRKRFKTEFPQKQNNLTDRDTIQEQIARRLPQMKPQDPRVIIIPINQPQTQIQPINSQSSRNMEIKYLQTINNLKSQQQANYLNLMQKQNQDMKKLYEQNMMKNEKQLNQNMKKLDQMENKYAKMINKMESKIQQQKKQQYENLRDPAQYEIPAKLNNRHLKTEFSHNNFEDALQKQYRQHHPDLQNIRTLTLQKPGYRINTETLPTLSQQQQLLLTLQHQQRDEFQLYSHLPEQIQKLKLQSIKALQQKRFEVEKEIIKQQIEKLKFDEEIKQFDLQRKLRHEELESEKKKIYIHKLMKRKVKNLAKQQFQDKLSEDQGSDLNQDPVEFDMNDPLLDYRPVYQSRRAYNESKNSSKISDPIN